MYKKKGAEEEHKNTWIRIKLEKTCFWEVKEVLEVEKEMFFLFKRKLIVWQRGIDKVLTKWGVFY